MLKKLISIILIIISQTICFSQDVPIGTWQDHLPYSDAISITEGNGLIYCATTSAIFTYNKADGMIERLNLVSGLSDIGLSKIRYNPFNKRVIIAYKNGNIDVIDENNTIFNLSFIKNSNVAGSKTINHIFLKGKLAYLSTDFGIVVLDTDKLEINDSYFFGPLGASTITNSITFDDNNIYAATNQGVFYANKNSTNLNDYNTWNVVPELGSNAYNSIVFHSNRLFVNSELPGANTDSIFYRDSGVWQKFESNGLTLQQMSVSNNTLIIVEHDKIRTYNDLLIQEKNIHTVNNWFTIKPQECVIDAQKTMWYAEDSYGLIKSKSNNNNEIITPKGPNSSDVFDIDFVDDELWIVSGSYGNYNSTNLINHRSKNEWKKTPKRIVKPNGTSSVYDLVSVTIDPQDPEHVYAGSWSSGLLEFNNGSLTTIFNESNSALSNSGNITVTGPIKFDNDNNLWILNSNTTNNLAVKTKDNEWYNFSLRDFRDVTLDEFHNMIIDQNNYKWMVNTTKHNIIIFDDNNTFNDTIDDQITLNKSVPGNGIYAIAEDQDGEIWIGTDEGIAVFYNPANVFNENIQAERIYIQQDGQTQILLETETITTIKIDGANRKWIGTQNSGVFLMSEDGTEEISHFTTENSPLFSNNIFDIEINQKNGEVFFGTEKGLLSYKGTATKAGDDFNNILVYPNPVKPDFTGTIAIRGLMKDTDVRITDISGNIVYKTTSLGGQAIWDGKDFNGNKVQTGVYMIFNGSPEGEFKAVAKILFIH